MTPEERRIREGFFGSFPRWAKIFVMIAALLVVAVMLITKGDAI